MMALAINTINRDLFLAKATQREVSISIPGLKAEAIQAGVILDSSIDESYSTVEWLRDSSVYPAEGFVRWLCGGVAADSPDKF